MHMFDFGQLFHRAARWRRRAALRPFSFLSAMMWQDYHI